jgi:hypothetical protein
LSLGSAVAFPKSYGILERPAHHKTGASGDRRTIGLA